MPRARCTDPESGEFRSGLSRSQAWAPSFRAGPLPSYWAGCRFPPALRVGSSPEPRGQSRFPRLLPGLTQREAHRRTAVGQSFLDSGLRVSGWRWAEIEPQSWLHKPWSLRVFSGRRAEPRLLASRRRPPSPRDAAS